MEHWDLHTLEVGTRQPRILHSARGEARSILIALAAGEGLQDHQVHERAYVVVIAGEVDLAGTTGGPGLAAVFEPDGYMREPAGEPYVHRGIDELRALYELFFSNGGGIPLEHCTVTDDGRACALEYNVVAWGRTPLPPEAGLAVYVRADSGRLAAARVYDDSDPPLR